MSQWTQCLGGHMCVYNREGVGVYVYKRFGDNMSSPLMQF